MVFAVCFFPFPSSQTEINIPWLWRPSKPQPRAVCSLLGVQLTPGLCSSGDPGHLASTGDPAFKSLCSQENSPVGLALTLLCSGTPVQAPFNYMEALGWGEKLQEWWSSATLVRKKHCLLPSSEKKNISLEHWNHRSMKPKPSTC